MPDLSNVSDPLDGDVSPRDAGGDTVRRGAWIGTVRNQVETYYGIRYARLSDAGRPGSRSTAASGQLKVEDMTAVPVFPQLPSRLEAVTGPAGRLNPQDDEAFFLNVWAPLGADRLPVLVFVHGGAWASGGGAMRWYRGERLAGDGIVVVTVNYRLGPAGHLDDDGGDRPVHQPFGDLLLALQWVGRHIVELGGDPDRVTLAGQSAGAWYAWALASLPEAEGLFRQAAILSIPQIAPWTPARRAAFTHRVVTLAAGQNGADRLLHAGVQALAETPRVAGGMPPMYLPMVAGTAAGMLENVATAAAHLHAEALYVRVTRHEMSVFLPPLEPGSAAAEEILRELRARARGEAVPSRSAPAWWHPQYAEAVEFASWLEFGRVASEIAEEVGLRGHDVMWREFAATGGPPHFGAVHCIDLPFQFGNFADWADAPMLAGWEPDAFEQVSRAVRTDLVEFVRGDCVDVHRTLGEGARAGGLF